jgi:hypothetical protein
MKKKLKTKISLIDLSLPKDWSEEAYNADHAHFIANYKTWVDGYYEKGKWVSGIFGLGGYFSENYIKGRSVNDPVLAESKWNEVYPNGYESWLSSKDLNPVWIIKNVAGKVNELIEVVNTLSDKK